jgi:hypothetical protein
MVKIVYSSRIVKMGVVQRKCVTLNPPEKAAKEPTKEGCKSLRDGLRWMRWMHCLACLRDFH